MDGVERKAAIPHVNALDGARGFAVAGVLLFHGGHLTGGYLGVDFFFTLSGFLITSLLLAEAGRTGSVGLGGFWARRARRLLPALALLMIGVALYNWTIATPVQLAQIRGDALATLAYVANWHEIFSHQDYFQLFNAPSPLNHTWSLAIEEQFYVIWPLLFVGLLTRFKRNAPQAVLITSLALAAVSSTLMIVLYNPNNTNRVYFGTDTRAAAILFGAALAAWLTIHGPITGRNARIALETAGIAAAIILAIAWTRLDGQSKTLYQGGFLVCGLAGTTIIAAATHPQPGILSRVLSLKWLCGLGLISYGVYLYHWPIDVALDQKQAGFGGWPLFALQTAVTLTLAIASYKLIEQPIRHGQLSTTQLAKLTPAIAIALILAILGSTSGARTPKTVNLEEHPLRAATRAYNRAPPGSQRVMIVGDSVAYFLGQSMQHIHTTPPLAVFNASTQGCAFPQHISETRRPQAYNVNPIEKTFTCSPDYYAGVVARFKPQLVIWIVSNPSDAAMYRGQWLDTCTSKQYASIYQSDLKKEITTLGSHGAKVVLTTAVYPRYLFAKVDKDTDCENRLRQEVVATTGTQLIDLNAYVCPDGQCREKQAGVTLRPDGEHFKDAGGELVAKWIYDQVR